MAITTRIGTGQADSGYRKAKADVRAAAAEVKRLEDRKQDMVRRATVIDQREDGPAAVALLKELDEYGREYVLARAKYDKAVEVASILGNIWKLKRAEEKARLAGDAKAADGFAAHVIIQSEGLKKLSQGIKIKLPPRELTDALSKQLNGLDNLQGLDGLFDSIKKAVSNVTSTVKNTVTAVAKSPIAQTVVAKAAQFGNWAVDNAPVIATAAAGAIAIAATGGAATPVVIAAAMAVGGAVGQVVKATKPEVKQEAPIPHPATPVEPPAPAAPPIPPPAPVMPNAGIPESAPIFKPGTVMNQAAQQVTELVKTQPPAPAPEKKSNVALYAGGGVAALTLLGLALRARRAAHA